MPVAAKTRENTASMTSEHKFLGGNRGNQCVKNLDETVRLQSKIRQEWIREIRGERLQGIAETQKALPVWLAHRPRHSPVEMNVRGPIVA